MKKLIMKYGEKMDNVINHFGNRWENHIFNDSLLAFEELTKSLNVINIGYCQIDSKQFENESSLEHRNLIIFILEMDEKIIKLGPSDEAKKLNKKLYAKIREKVDILSEFLNENNFETQIAYPNEKLINLPYLAQKAGLGQIGINRLLITPELGPRVKIAGILTSIENLPFYEDSKKYQWIEKYCTNCEECIESCISDSLINNNGNCRDTNNDVIVEFDEEKCTGSEEACSYCIEKCPFYKKDYLKIKEEFNRSENKGG